MSAFNRVHNGHKILPTTAIATTIASVAIVLLLPEIAQATAPTATTGIEGVSTQVYELLDGSVGTLAAILGGLTALFGVIGPRGFQWPVLAGGAGVALTATTAPSVMLALSGSGIF